jgi:hypothetical protein
MLYLGDAPYAERGIEPDPAGHQRCDVRANKDQDERRNNEQRERYGQGRTLDQASLVPFLPSKRCRWSRLIATNT